jgi:hypothetical protein
MTCAICGGARDVLGEALIMSRYRVAYFRCTQCGFVQTEKPYWLDEAYENPIIDSDVGYVDRNIRFASIAKAVISTGFDPNGKFLDYGGGYGLFVRLMRDRGFDFYRDDPYCENLFARGFDRTGSEDGNYELVTAFEVAEHLPDPVDGFEAMMRRGSSVLFSTVLLPNPTPKPGEWWYYSVEGGQHVSLYSRESLALLADRLGVKVKSSRNGDRHLFTNSTRALTLFPFVSRKNVARLIRPKRESLTQNDYEASLIR